MVNLTRAHKELFRRSPDECFETLTDLTAHCHAQREAASELWYPPGLLMPQVGSDTVQLHMGNDAAYALNHWSFSQFCGLCGVGRDTINRLSP